MCLHNHWHIVCSVSNWYSNPVAVLFCKRNHISLLFGTHSTTDDTTSK
jgi:hypothetical protein